MRVDSRGTRPRIRGRGRGARGQWSIWLPLLVLGLAISPLLGTAGAKESVFSSPHNLSASGGRGKHAVAFAEESRVCVFCHVPHHARGAEPLWSRDLPSDADYIPYDSSTLKASVKPDRPTGASRLCLSCHDGTIALGQFAGSRIAGGGTPMPHDPIPTRNPRLGKNLSDDHPVSFPYTEAADAELVAPGNLPAAIRLRDGLLQCTSCHDPHNNQFGNFLVLDNREGSPLCVVCHQKSGWDTSGHNPVLSPTLTDGCLSCHYVHSAPEPNRLLHSPQEEENCYLSCHDGSGGGKDVKSLFSPSLYRHPVDMATGVHDPQENLPATAFHVECVDCHNPHRAAGAEGSASSPPYLSPALQGVRIDNAGTLATSEYDICFKCHAGASAGTFSGVTQSRPNRLIGEPNQRNRFDGVNPSFHPVTADRRGSGASLYLPLQGAMLRISCSDCHSSDRGTRAGGSGANGPHGSNFEHILLARYEMPPPSAMDGGYSPDLYDLCFRCHAEDYVLGNGSSFGNQGTNEHTRHVRDRAIPCFACHDPHGVPAVAGATAAANAHLINFDLDYTTSPAVPAPRYQSLAPASGSCTVSCHSGAGGTRSYSR